PKKIDRESYLEVKISAGDEKWVQCDGVQLTEGSKASVYQPEDSAWEMSKGYYPVMGPVGYLWLGVAYPNGSHNLKPTKNIENCRNGWILQWSRYIKGDGEVNSHFQYTVVHKSQYYTGGTYGMSIALSYSVASPNVRKYVYIDGETIKGHDDNGKGVDSN